MYQIHKSTITDTCICSVRRSGLCQNNSLETVCFQQNNELIKNPLYNESREDGLISNFITGTIAPCIFEIQDFVYVLRAPIFQNHYFSLLDIDTIEFPDH